MTYQDASAVAAESEPVATTSSASSATSARPPAPASFQWRRGALLLAGAAQLITISALVSADPLKATWSALLLAIAPAPLAAVSAFAPAPAARLAGVAGLVALAVGIIGGVTHTGLFFVPAFVVLALGMVMFWRERS
jgi:hypothetical protein